LIGSTEVPGGVTKARFKFQLEFERTGRYHTCAKKKSVVQESVAVMVAVVVFAISTLSYRGWMKMKFWRPRMKGQGETR